MKYEKIFLSITFLLTYFISIILLPKGFIGALTIIIVIPAFAAIISILMESRSLKVLLNPFTYKITLKGLIFAIAFPLIVIFLCGSSAYLTKQGVLSENISYIFLDSIKITLISLTLFIAGLFEEYGWRGYLLPRLLKRYSIKRTNFIMGIIWSLYYVPAFFILNMHFGLPKAVTYVVLQCAAIFALNYCFTYLYTMSPNVILPSIMHILWNNINIATLGYSYNNVSYGFIIGNVKIINGEGLLGLIFLSIFAIYAHRKFSNHPSLNI
ncbi:MAG: CPBP family intramembrane metalloprotease [Clostridium beijerinckii]|nr:CPBP family intramembrane metalloprotease [Clostridium beijerinckii]